MPYREKTAWLSLLAMLVVFIPYFTWAEMHPPASEIPNLSQMGIYASASLSWMVILGIGHLLLRFKTPDEAKLPMDERDLAIAHTARKYAYGVLVTGMIVVGCVMPFTDTGWKIANTAIFMIILAECVFEVNVLRLYRKQSS